MDPGVLGERVEERQGGAPWIGPDDIHPLAEQALPEHLGTGVSHDRIRPFLV